MEAVGSASAIADLAGLAMKASIAAKHVVQSFINAPTELVHLSSKVDRMRALIDQVDEMNKCLPMSDNAVLLTPEHQEMLFLGFRKNFETLGRIQSLCGLSEADSRRAKVRFHWAVFDKKKATRILKESRILEMDLDIPLHILGMRVALLNHNAISTVGASQALLHTRLTDSFQDIKIWMRSEMGSLLDDKLHSALDGPKLLPDLDCGTASRSAAKDFKGLIVVKDLGRYPGTEPQPSSLLRIRQTQPEYRTPGIQLIDHDMRRTLQSYSSVIGNIRSLPDVTGPKATIGAQVTLDSKRRRRRARIVVSAAFRLFCGRVLQFELQAQLTARRWTITPWLGCSMRIYNLRPSYAPIFLACKDRDFEEVRYLLESGQASVYDGDEEIGGLIEHVVLGWDVSNDFAKIRSARPFHGQGELLLEHLLDQGCDPQLNNGKMYAFSWAFQKQYEHAITHMMRHVADDETVLYFLAGRFGIGPRDVFEWKVSLLRSFGFSDWKLESNSDHLLHGACWARSLEEVLFALELAGIDPNLTGGRNPSAICNAAQINWIEGLAVLIECGAKVNTSEASWKGPPLIRCIFMGQMLGAAHYLLLQGADTTMVNWRSENAWYKIWGSEEDLKTWSYIDFERDVTHLLLHNADPFEIFNTKIEALEEADAYFPTGFDLVGQIRAAEMARARSYDQNLSERADDFDYEYYEEAEIAMQPHFFATWSNLGEIYHAKDNDSVLSDDEDGPTDEGYEASSDENNSSDGEDITSRCYSLDDYASSIHSPRNCASAESLRNDGVSRTSELNQENNDNEVEYCSDSGSTSSSSSSERFLPSLEYNHPPRAVGLFRNTTSFYSHISHPEGRRQMSRFPAVRAFCDALQNAGYRAQMDDNGDIWYDCEDGDRYFDAQEFQPAREPSDWLVEACPICQDFERFGLGNVLKCAENGKRALREYRDKVKEKRRNYI